MIFTSYSGPSLCFLSAGHVSALGNMWDYSLDRVKVVTSEVGSSSLITSQEAHPSPLDTVRFQIDTTSDHDLICGLLLLAKDRKVRDH